MKRTPLFIPALMFALGSAASAASPASGSVNITVTGLHSTKGALILCLWKDKQGFPTCQNSRTALRKRVVVTAPSMLVRLDDIQPGQYAITVQHDENNDGKMQSNFIGMPKEGVGVSNNPGGMPGFSKSLFGVTADSAIIIRMKYLFE